MQQGIMQIGKLEQMNSGKFIIVIIGTKTF
jgi:hypothetical protein